MSTSNDLNVVTTMLNSPPTFQHVTSDAMHHQLVSNYYKIVLQATLANFNKYINKLTNDEGLVAEELAVQLEVMQRAVTAYTMANSGLVRAFTPRRTAPQNDPRPEDMSTEETTTETV
jgi:hypothetical protein